MQMSDDGPPNQQAAHAADKEALTGFDAEVLDLSAHVVGSVALSADV